MAGRNILNIASNEVPVQTGESPHRYNVRAGNSILMRIIEEEKENTPPKILALVRDATDFLKAALEEQEKKRKEVDKYIIEKMNVDVVKKGGNIKLLIGSEIRLFNSTE